MGKDVKPKKEIKLKYADLTPDIQDDKVKVIMSKEIVDRDGEVMEIDGMDITNYKKNPIVCWGHKTIPTRFQPVGDIEDVVGKAENLQKGIDKDGIKILTADIEFADHPKAQYLQSMVKKGMITTVSVGFNNYQDNIIVNEGIGFVKKSEVLELSFTPLPANTEARVINSIKSMKLEQKDEDAIFTKLLHLDDITPKIKAYRKLFLSKEFCKLLKYEKTGNEILDAKNIFDRLIDKITFKPKETPKVKETPKKEVVISKNELKNLILK